MARKHHLITELNIEECKNRLKESVQMATFLPEMRGKCVIGGIWRDRFWIQSARSHFYRGDIWLPVFYGRLTPDESGTKIRGHFALQPVGRAVITILVGVLCFGLILVDALNVARALVASAIIVVLIIWMFRREWERNKRLLLSFLRRMLEAKPSEPLNG